MKKIKDLLKIKNKKDPENEYDTNFSKIQDTERSKRENTFYFIFFIIILIAAVILKFTDNNDKEKTNTTDNSTNQEVSTNEDKEYLKDLDKNNYDVEINIIADTDLLNLLIRKESFSKELISKTYRDETAIYYINSNKTYKSVSSDFILDNNPNIYNEYDTTFFNVLNLKELINKHTYEVSLKEEEYNIQRYKIEISRVIDTYNEYNKTSLKKRVSGEVILDINYTNEKLIGLKLDLTSLYENLDYDYRKVIYTYEFDNFNEIDIDSFMKLPSE